MNKSDVIDFPSNYTSKEALEKIINKLNTGNMLVSGLSTEIVTMRIMHKFN